MQVGAVCRCRWTPKQLESGHTRLLESVLGQVDTQEKREQILKAVQDLNEKHIQGEQAGQHLPKIEFEKSGAWPWAGGDDLVLYRTANGKKDVLYAEDDWKDDDNKLHVHKMDHRP